MADNSWIVEDRDGANTAQSKLMRTKVIITVALIVAAGLCVVLFHNVGSNATLYQSEGIVVDYGGYRTMWTDIGYTSDSATTDPVKMLETACNAHGVSFSTDSEGKPVAIDYIDPSKPTEPPETVANTPEASWGLWTVDDNGNMKAADSLHIKASDYKVTIWAYTLNSGGRPAVAVDATNTPVYGYATASRVVTMSPLTTETVCYVGGSSSTIVATDSYSNYPQSIVDGKNNGSIGIIGSYLSPSYESIMNANPDLVVCDGSTSSHFEMAKKVRNSNANAVVIYDPVDIKTICDNIFLVSAAMNYGTAGRLIGEMTEAIEAIEAKIAGHEKTSTMMSLGAVASPYVAASHTYASDILAAANGTNVFGDMNGWPLVNSESIPDRNPSLIIVIDPDSYKVSEYDEMMNSISKTTWKDTDAYKEGDVYLFAEQLGNMAQVAGPRFAQFLEITARILNPDCFDDVQQTRLNATKAIGSDYTDYLSFTRHIGV